MITAIYENSIANIIFSVKRLRAFSAVINKKAMLSLVAFISDSSVSPSQSN